MWSCGSARAPPRIRRRKDRRRLRGGGGAAGHGRRCHPCRWSDGVRGGRMWTATSMATLRRARSSTPSSPYGGRGTTDARRMTERCGTASPRDPDGVAAPSTVGSTARRQPGVRRHESHEAPGVPPGARDQGRGHQPGVPHFGGRGSCSHPGPQLRRWHPGAEALGLHPRAAAAQAQSTRPNPRSGGALGRAGRGRGAPGRAV